MIPYTKTASSISLVINFTSTVIPKSHPNFDKIAELVVKPGTTEADLKPLLDIPAAIAAYTGGNVTVINGKLYFKGYEITGNIAKVVLDFVKSGQDDAAQPFVKFIEKAAANPDPRAMTDLFDWVAAVGLPITPDGDLLAWKAVGTDYFSIHTGPRGKLRHAIGDVVEEPRHETDGDPNRTCSRGLHFCEQSYLKHYAAGGSRVVAVTISPTDVVAFPKDYGNAKGRACKLTVVGEIPHDKVAEFYPQGRKVYGGWSAPVKASPTHEAGQSWVARNGDITRIVSTDEAGAYPLKDASGRRYTAKGRFNSDSSESQFDLIRRA